MFGLNPGTFTTLLAGQGRVSTLDSDWDGAITHGALIILVTTGIHGAITLGTTAHGTTPLTWQATHTGQDGTMQPITGTNTRPIATGTTMAAEAIQLAILSNT